MFDVSHFFFHDIWDGIFPFSSEASVFLAKSISIFDDIIPGGPEITEQSIQSIFQDFALINSYFLRLVG